jgi:hypothetical protein
MHMTVKKTLQERQSELQALLATPAGKNELQKLALRYSATSNRTKTERGSVITYILVHEREHGLIDG